MEATFTAGDGNQSSYHPSTPLTDYWVVLSLPLCYDISKQAVMFDKPLVLGEEAKRTS